MTTANINLSFFSRNMCIPNKILKNFTLVLINGTTTEGEACTNFEAGSTY